MNRFLLFNFVFSFGFSYFYQFCNLNFLFAKPHNSCGRPSSPYFTGKKKSGKQSALHSALFIEFTPVLRLLRSMPTGPCGTPDQGKH